MRFDFIYLDENYNVKTLEYYTESEGIQGMNLLLNNSTFLKLDPDNKPLFGVEDTKYFILSVFIDSIRVTSEFFSPLERVANLSPFFDINILEDSNFRSGYVKFNSLNDLVFLDSNNTKTLLSSPPEDSLYWAKIQNNSIHTVKGVIYQTNNELYAIRQILEDSKEGFVFPFSGNSLFENSINTVANAQNTSAAGCSMRVTFAGANTPYTQSPTYALKRSFASYKTYSPWLENMATFQIAHPSTNNNHPNNPANNIPKRVQHLNGVYSAGTTNNMSVAPQAIIEVDFDYLTGSIWISPFPVHGHSLSIISEGYKLVGETGSIMVTTDFKYFSENVDAFMSDSV
jgi:hypothetical protein